MNEDPRPEIIDQQFEKAAANNPNLKILDELLDKVKLEAGKKAADALCSELLNAKKHEGVFSEEAELKFTLAELMFLQIVLNHEDILPISAHEDLETKIKDYLLDSAIRVGNE